VSSDDLPLSYPQRGHESVVEGAVSPSGTPRGHEGVDGVKELCARTAGVMFIAAVSGTHAQHSAAVFLKRACN
jgi:hypothetical protein